MYGRTRCSPPAFPCPSPCRYWLALVPAEPALRVPPGSTGALQKVFRWTDAVLQLLQVRLAIYYGGTRGQK